MNRSFDARAFLEDLPELLAGSRPVLETAQARAKLIEDPQTRAALLLAGSVASALQRGAVEFAIDPADVPLRLRRSAEVAAQSFGRGLASVIFDVGLYCLDKVLTDSGGAVTWVGPGRNSMPRPFDAADVSRAVNETRNLLGVPCGKAVGKFLARLGHPEDHRAMLRVAMDACDALIPGMDEPRHTRLLVDPTCDADPDRWLAVSRECSSMFHVGASLQEVGLAYVKRQNYPAAVLANAEARRYLGLNMGLASNGLLAALLASDARSARVWVLDLVRALSSGGSSGATPESTIWLIRARRAEWREASRLSIALVRAVERDLPPDVARTINEVTS